MPKIQSQKFLVHNSIDDYETMIVEKNGVKMFFDYKLHTNSGWVAGCIIYPQIRCIFPSDRAMTSVNVNQPKININDFHYIMGHTFYDRLKNTSLHYDINLVGKLEDCIDCGLGKYSATTPIGESGCTDCIAGTYVETTGSDDSTDCIACGVVFRYFCKFFL